MTAKPAATFELEDLLHIYKEWDSDGRAYEHIGEIFDIAKGKYAAMWHSKPGQAGDLDQSWRNWGGNNFEHIVEFLVQSVVKHLNEDSGLNLGIATDKALGKGNLPPELDRLKRNLLIDYGVYGSHLPDADLIVYERETVSVICILSCKVSLRERIAQTAYWKLKLLQSDVTRHIHVALATSDKALIKAPVPGKVKKNYAIASTDIDTTYVLNEALQPTDRIKSFSDFARDVKSWAKRGGGGGGGL